MADALVVPAVIPPALTPLLEEPYWLAWRPVNKPGKDKPIKKPIGSEWPKQRNTYDEILQQHGSDVGLGFIYCDTHPYVCIDVDDGRESSAHLVDQLSSYTEWSPSGNGAHVIVLVDDKQSLIEQFGKVAHNTGEKRDLYISSGYVTITGRVVPFYANESIKAYTAEELIQILLPYFGGTNKILSHPSTIQPSLSGIPVIDTNIYFKTHVPNEIPIQKQYTESEVQQALLALPVKYLPDNTFVDFPVLNLDDPEPPEARTPWLMVGQALHHYYYGSMSGLMLWDNWSKQGNKYDQDALTNVWYSFHNSYVPDVKPITIATIMKLLKAQQPEYIMVGNPPKPAPTLYNINLYLDFIKPKIRFNVVSSLYEVIFNPKTIAPLHNNQTIVPLKHAAAVVEGELYMQGFRDQAILRKIISALQLRAQEAEHYSPITDYFNTLPKWDGIPRIDELADTIIAENANNHAAYKIFLRKWLIQVAAAAYTTHTKPNRLNMVLILQGAQGIGKTNWIESLFPKAIAKYCVGSKSVNISRFRSDMVKLTMELTSTIICSINEIDTLFNHKNFADFKQFLDTTTDKVVLPYGDSPVNVLRSTVFIGSTNENYFLTDFSGNRRFMLIKAKYFNFKHNVDLDKLWAEIKYYYKRGETWWLCNEPTALKLLNEQTGKHKNNTLRAALEHDAALLQQIQNKEALDFVDDHIQELLSTTFDASQPLTLWRYYTYPAVRALLSLPKVKTSKREKLCLQHWQEVVANIHPDAKSVLKINPLAKAPSAQGTPWKYLMPPLRIDTNNFDE